MKWSWIGIGSVAVLLAGCSKGRESVQPPGSGAMMSREVQAAAQKQGAVIVEEAFAALSSKLQSAIQEGGISNALQYCSVAALPLTKSVAEKRGVILRRISHKARNPENRAEGIELAILKSFQDSLSEMQAPSPVVTNIAPGKATFFSPIVLRHPVCLKCHGEPGKDISPEDTALIARLYPADQATGFKAGELRGAWRVDMPTAGLEESSTR